MSVADERRARRNLRARQRRGIADLRADVIHRMNHLGSMRLNTPLRQLIYEELFSPFSSSQFPMFPSPDRCSVEAPTHVIDVGGTLVDLKRRQMVGQIERHFDLSAGFVHHEFLSLQRPYRGAGLAPELLLQSFDVYDALDLSTVTVHAGLETGRWYWGSVGFDFVDPAEATEVARWMQHGLAAAGIRISTSHVSSAYDWAILGTQGAKVTTSLHHLGTSIASVPASHLEPGRAGTVPGPLWFAYIAERNDLDPHKQLTVGRALMLGGPWWHGEFDLRSTAQRTLFRRRLTSRLRRSAAAASP